MSSTSSTGSVVKLLQWTLFLLLVSLVGCATYATVDVSLTEIMAAEEKAGEEIRNELAVMPDWYRASLVPSHSIQATKKTESLLIFSHTVTTNHAVPAVKEPLFLTGFFLSLIVYLVFVPVILWLVINSQNSGNWSDDNTGQLLVGTVASVVGLYIVAAILALIIVMFAQIGFQIAYAKPHYFYYSFTFLSVNAFFVCVMLVVSLNLLAFAVAGRPIFSPSTTPSGTRQATSRWVLGNMLRAAIVFILSGIGSHVAGIVGAGIVFVITAGIATMFGINDSSHTNSP